MKRSQIFTGCPCVARLTANYMTLKQVKKKIHQAKKPDYKVRKDEDLKRMKEIKVAEREGSVYLRGYIAKAMQVNRL